MEKKTRIIVETNLKIEAYIGKTNKNRRGLFTSAFLTFGSNIQGVSDKRN